MSNVTEELGIKEVESPRELSPNRKVSSQHGAGAVALSRVAGHGRACSAFGERLNGLDSADRGDCLEAMISRDDSRDGRNSLLSTNSIS
jgi:hypothetical protein